MAAPGGRRARWSVTLRSTWFKVGAAVVAAGALVAGAFAAGGYDVAQTKVDDSSVWALQTGQGERYARVDTALGELDTVKSVTSPSDLVQSSGHVLLYSQSDAKVASVDLAQPAAYTATSSGFSDTPAGTVSVVHTGDYVAYLSNTGAVRAGRIEDGTKTPQTVTSPGKGGTRAFSADTVAIGTDGVLYAYSHTTHAVLRYDITTGRTLGTDAVATGPDRPGATITAVGDTWALLAPGGARLWIRGVRGALPTSLSGKPVLQQPSAKRAVVVVADASRLVSFQLKNGTRTRLADQLSGTPAAPAWQGSTLYAAWVPTGGGQGTLWTGRPGLSGELRAKTAKLDYAGKTLRAAATPVFRGNGSSEILNDTTSGWIWSVPSGKIVQGSQNWDLNQKDVTAPDPQNKPTERETNPEPPVAVDDAFGVRAGSLVSLPVMLNDSDPNGDVISIVPGSLTGLDPGFGTASIANNAQAVTVQVKPGATGTATFQYTVTDGTAGGGGLKSKPATVTLTVSPAGANRAPAWCNNDRNCLYQWPSGVSVAPGGSVKVPVLRGWVDPDGDAMFAQSTATGTDYTVSVSPDGTVVFQALATAQPGPVRIPVTISDVNGATAEKDLQITITAQPTLQVENFGLMTAAGVPLTVDPSSHIRGAKGTPRITSATLATSNLADSGSANGGGADAEATVNVDSSGSTFDFTAKQPGSYPVTMTVSDSATKATVTGTVRITVVPPDQPLLSTSPVTVFVRPQTDTSVDVFSAVQNPTGRVLLLSDPSPKPADGASLDVDVVGQSQLRVRGTTGTGSPGLLGTVDYTVSDGTNAQNMTVAGVATVYLLPEKSPTRPVAINDSVTVRAGAQVDIPVLANDVGPNGDIVELDPSSIQNASHQGLAFASGQVLRYLAPQTSPGSTPITLRYSAYSAGNPSAKSEATVSVTILSKDGDRPPQPQTLTGRVTAGASVRIPFNPYGVDPDGDMVTLDRIMTQPDDGTAQISADGTAIVFTALADSQGQQSFTYRVRDAQGETGQATVMVGVLNAQTDPAPVTFSDYVQVQAGQGHQVVVQPASNDVDPTGGELQLVSVTPDAPKGTAAYELLQQHIGSQNSSRVVITSTPLARTLTYTYSVKNAQGDVSAGLIVVDVVVGHVPDYPIAVDTVVDAQNRGRLAQGIDVVAGKVSWGSGDIAGLKLSLYKKIDGVSVDGDAIKVTHVPSAGLLVPFKLTGDDFTGRPATTYGFLRVPALADVILALKSDAKPLKVAEGGTKSVGLRSIVSIPSGQVLNAQSGEIKTTKARKNATCSIDSQNNLTYDAGDGAPWTDACLAPVRLGGQSEYTMIAVPVQVIPKKPLPELRPASLTVSPGQGAVKFDLRQMTTWLGHSDLSGLDFNVAYGGHLFSVVRSGQTISVRANDTAQPGLEEVAQVSIRGYSGVGTTADITLKVGPAPNTRPAGGSVALSCSEAQGSSCSTTVVGLRDEVNAYPGTPLKVVSVADTVTGCTGVTFAVSDSRTVSARWAADSPGGRCTVPFDVQDAQGKRSASGAEAGTLSFELKGYPAAPASVSQVAFSGDSVTLAVSPGDAASSYPALTGFHVYVDGRASVSCDANGACPPVKGLKNGDQHTFQVKSVNSVGESRTAVQTAGWAFAQPVVGGVSAKPVFDGNITTATTGAFDLTIPNTDSTASAYTVQWSGNTQTVNVGGGDHTTVRLSAAAGQPTEVTVTPVSRFDQPPGDSVGASPASTSVTPAGSPSISWSGGFTTTDNSITVSPAATGVANGSSKDPAYLYIATASGDPSCTNDGDDNIHYVTPSDGSASPSPTIGDLNQGETYQVYACYTNQFGAAQQRLGSVFVWDQGNAPTPSGCSYDITSQGGSGLPSYDFSGRPSCDSGAHSGLYTLNVSGSTATWDVSPSFTAQYCYPGTQYCGHEQTSFNATHAPYRMQITSVATSCTSDALGMSITGGNNYGAAGATIDPKTYSYTDADGNQQDGDASKPIPAGATNVVITEFTIDFSGPAAFTDYDSGTVSYSVDTSSCGIPAAASTTDQSGASDTGN